MRSVKELQSASDIIVYEERISKARDLFQLPASGWKKFNASSGYVQELNWLSKYIIITYY